MPKCNIACPTCYIQYLHGCKVTPWPRIQCSHKIIFPQSVYSQGHDIIHSIITRSNWTENLADETFFDGLWNCLEAKMRAFIVVAGWITGCLCWDRPPELSAASTQSRQSSSWQHCIEQQQSMRIGLDLSCKMSGLLCADITGTLHWTWCRFGRRSRISSNHAEAVKIYNTGYTKWALMDDEFGEIFLNVPNWKASLLRTDPEEETRPLAVYILFSCLA